METHRLYPRRRNASGGDRILCLQEKEPSPGAGGGTPHPSHRSHPGATVARPATPRLRHQHQTTGRTSRCLSPGPCPHGVGHTRHQEPRRAVPLPIRELLRQRRLAFLRHPCSQPLPMDNTPHPPSRNQDGSSTETQSAPACSVCPEESSTTDEDRSCASPPDGHGPTPTTPLSPASATCRNSADPAHSPTNKPTAKRLPQVPPVPTHYRPGRTPRQTGRTPTEPSPTRTNHPPPLPITPKTPTSPRSDTPIGDSG